MTRLAKIATKTVKKVGIFHNRPTSFIQQMRGNHTELLDTWQEKLGSGDEAETETVMKQTGIIRTNCVDCLDRTNTAQFAVGLSALGFQLHALGVLPQPRLEIETDCVRMLEEMYEDHGDTLALQYGGSALIHRIKTYRKQSPWTSKGNDIMQTMRRYYSNTLSDAEKQNTMNIFLGIFRPHPNQAPIWERDNNSDYYLHHQEVKINISKPLTQWWDQNLINHLPLPRELAEKSCTQLVYNQNNLELFEDYYRPFELTVLQDLFTFSEINHSVRDYMPHFTTDYSPFSARVRQGKKREEMTMNTNKNKPLAKNPSIAGNSTSSSTSTEEDSDESNENDDDDDDFEIVSNQNDDVPSQCSSKSSGYISFASLFPPENEVSVPKPSASDMQLYRSMASLSKMSGPPMFSRKVSLTSLPHPLGRNIDSSAPCPIPVHDYEQILLKPISKKSMEIYENHVRVGLEGAGPVKPESLALYERYVSMEGLCI